MLHDRTSPTEPGTQSEEVQGRPVRMKRQPADDGLLDTLLQRRRPAAEEATTASSIREETFASLQSGAKHDVDNIVPHSKSTTAATGHRRARRQQAPEPDSEAIQGDATDKEIFQARISGRSAWKKGNGQDRPTLGTESRREKGRKLLAEMLADEPELQSLFADDEPAFSSAASACIMFGGDGTTEFHWELDDTWE